MGPSFLTNKIKKSLTEHHLNLFNIWLEVVDRRAFVSVHYS